MGQLNRLFGSRGVASFCPFEADEPTVNLMVTLFEGRETTLPSVTESYEAYFEGRSIADIPNLPPSLQRLMDLLRHCAAADHNPFSNGAGKQFLTELLCLSSVIGEHWVVRSSTTSNPTTDWCGVVPQGTEPQLTGVVDIMLKTVEGETLLVGEVKYRPVRNGVANLQLLAELRMLQQRNRTRGIIGLLYLPQAEGARFR